MFDIWNWERSDLFVTCENYKELEIKIGMWNDNYKISLFKFQETYKVAHALYHTSKSIHRPEKRARRGIVNILTAAADETRIQNLQRRQLLLTC